MAQTGAFTCHMRTKAKRFIPFELNTFYKDRLVKIGIPAGSVSKVRDQLNASGVNSVSLFPDLDGLASHLQFRYFHDVEPKL